MHITLVIFSKAYYANTYIVDIRTCEGCVLEIDIDYERHLVETYLMVNSGEIVY